MSGHGFFRLATLAEALELCRQHFGELRMATEAVPTPAALGRVLAEEIRTAEPVPHFARSTMDGYAVAAASTHGASDGAPADLRLVGRVPMGEAPDFAVAPGEAAEIATGGALPAGADAVVMVEYTELLGATEVQVSRPVSVGENAMQVGEDLQAGEVCLSAGRVLRPPDLALLGAIGCTAAHVRARPRVACLATGDEVVAPDTLPAPGQVRDANSWGLMGAVAAAGGEPFLAGRAPDRHEEMLRLAHEGLWGADLLVLSGGSSVGTRDLALQVLGALGAPGVLLHGIAIKPGKPVIIANAGGKPAFGMPGHPLSALVAFSAVVRPLLGSMLGAGASRHTVRATLSRSVPSEAGRHEFVRVRLVETAAGLVAEPRFSKSAALAALADADGLVEVPLGVEGFDTGTEVAVALF